MSVDSSLILVGVGGAGCTMARAVRQNFGSAMRHLLVDTDSTSGAAGASPFIQLGTSRLGGRGSGGDIVAARMAADETISALDESFEGVRLAIILTALGGGTGGGASLEILRYLSEHGIPAVVFATTPFSFEGEARHRNSRGVMPMIADVAPSSIFIPLDRLADGSEEMDTAMRRALETISAGVAFFWRILETPGYIRLDAERLRKIIQLSGRGRFASVLVSGENRAAKAVDSLVSSPLLVEGSSPVRSILCGILAGKDLRLAEIAQIADAIRTAFGQKCDFELATVNDEEAFSGSLGVVLMLFESPTSETDSTGKRNARRVRATKPILAAGPQGRGWFNNTAPTIWHGEDLDIPTFLRKGIALDF